MSWCAVLRTRRARTVVNIEGIVPELATRFAIISPDTFWVGQTVQNGSHCVQEVCYLANFMLWKKQKKSSYLWLHPEICQCTYSKSSVLLEYQICITTSTVPLDFDIHAFDKAGYCDQPAKVTSLQRNTWHNLQHTISALFPIWDRVDKYGQQLEFQCLSLLARETVKAVPLGNSICSGGSLLVLLPFQHNISCWLKVFWEEARIIWIYKVLIDLYCGQWVALHSSPNWSKQYSWLVPTDQLNILGHKLIPLGMRVGFRDFRADKTFITCWSGSRVWVQVWAPAGHLAITPKKAIPQDNQRFWLQNKWPSSWGSSPALLGLFKLAST